MYQTVGHSGLFSIATALGLPLFTQDITGKPLNVGGEYGSRQASNKGKGRGTEGDETEDLYTLLLKVVVRPLVSHDDCCCDGRARELTAGFQTAMPEVKAVACGAILSNYQRVRVEHVYASTRSCAVLIPRSCARLNLIPIAFLWERNQEELLSEMVSAGMGSVLVKVAGAGYISAPDERMLTGSSLVEEHLGKSLAEMQSTLLRLVRLSRLPSRSSTDNRPRIGGSSCMSAAKEANTKPSRLTVPSSPTASFCPSPQPLSELTRAAQRLTRSSPTPIPTLRLLISVSRSARS